MTEKQRIKILLRIVIGMYVTEKEIDSVGIDPALRHYPGDLRDKALDQIAAVISYDAEASSILPFTGAQ